MTLSKSLGSLQLLCSTFKVLNCSKWGLNGMDCSSIIYSIALVSVIVVLHLTLITYTEIRINSVCDEALELIVSEMKLSPDD